MVKRGMLLAVTLVALFSMALSSAEIIYSQPDSLYNIGDELNLTITLISQKDTSSFFISTLVCNSNEVEIYKSPFTLKEGDKKTIDIQVSLDKFIIADSEGECFIKSTYGEEEKASNNFEITSNVDVMMNLQGITFSPGNEVKASGQAVKANGMPLSGFVKIYFSGTNISYTNEVVDGEFNFNFTLPDNIKAGMHELKVAVYEKNSFGEITNHGETASTIKISQIPKKLDIAISSNTIVPGNEFTYTVLITDQAGDIVEQNVPVIIYLPDGSIFEKNLVKVNEANSFSLETSSPPGYWKINARFKDLEATRTFYVEELETATFTLINTTLVITNTGNVKYEKPIEVSFGGTKEIKDVTLDVGESKELRLLAPDGEYEIQVSDGTQSENLGKVLLTGNAIALGDIGGTITKNAWMIVWTLVILILATVTVILVRRYLKNRTKNKPPVPIQSSKIKPLNPQKQSTNLIDKGQKHESSVISLNIKNLEDLSKPALETIDSALWKIKESGAKIYTDGNYRIIILSPALTKTKDTSYKAITLAQTLERNLTQFNRHTNNKIEFGIGVNIGDLITESKDGKFRFISVGNTISLSKKISTHAKNKVLISEAIHRKTSTKVKAQKIQDANLWEIKRIIDRSQHEDYIKKFLSEQKETKK